MPDPAPSEEAAVPPENVPSEQAPVVEVPEPKEIDDPAVSDLVTVEEVDVPEAAARALTSTEDSIIEQVDLKPFHMAAVSWNQDIEATGVEILMSIRVGGAWTTWQALSVADGEGSPSASDPLWTSEAADGVRARVTSDQGPLPDLKITTVDPGDAGAVDYPAVYARDQSGVVESTAVSRPAIISRAGWGAGPGTGCRTAPLAMRSVIIHHTAGANSYSRTESAGIVRSYQTMHIRTNGWCDIGYNFLVDKYGQIFEGRAGSINGHVAGAHAGHVSMSTNMNRVSTGIAMMGNFESANIWNAEWTTLRNTVAQLTAWRLQSFGLKPLTRVSYNGRTHFTVSGHRDWMATACPGRYGLDWLNAGNGLRAQVDRLMLRNTPPPPEPKPVVRGLSPENVQSAALTLRWSAYPGAARYRIYFSTSSTRPTTCAGGGCYDVSGDQLRRSFTGLKPGTSYYARIVAMNGSGEALTDWHETPLTITTMPIVRGLTAQDLQADRVGFRWSAVKGAARYRMYLSTSRNRPVTCATGDCYDVPGDQLTRSFTGLEPDTTYYARVVAMDASGRALTDWHETPLTVSTLPLVKGLRFEGLETTRVTLRWDSLPSAARYRLFVSTSPNFPTVCASACHDVAPGKTAYDLSGLRSGTTYYARVVALDANSKAVSGWQPTAISFRTPTISSALVQGLRTEAVMADRATFRWNPVKGAARYRLYVSTSPKLPTTCGGSCHDTRASEAQRVVTGLDQGTRYYARVVAMDAAGNGITDWQEAAVSFTTMPLVRGLTATSVTHDSVDFRWRAFPGASRYRIHLSKSPDRPMTCGGECHDVEGSQLNAHIKGLESGTKYYARIVAMNGAGVGVTDWHPTALEIAVPERVTAIQDLALENARADSLTFRWGAVAGASRYRVYVSTSPAKPTTCGVSCFDTKDSQLTLTVRGLDFATRYYARVVALNAQGRGITDWSETAVVATTESLVRGLTASETQSDRVTLRWNAFGGAARYRLHISTSPGRPSTCGGECRDVVGDQTSLVVTGLRPDTTYYARVVAMNGAGAGITDWHPTALKVTTAAEAGNATNVGYVRNGSLTVKGRGYGHGIGMSQYGAKGGAESGRSYAQILAHYYGGTTLSTRSSHVRVHITAATSPEVTVMAVPGLRIQTVSGWDAALPTSVSGRSVSQWRIARGADTTTSRVQYRSGNSWYDYGSPWRGDGQFGVPNGTVTLVLPNGRQVAYRGVMKSVVPPGNPSARVTVNELFSLDDYIRGVVPREMPASWHPEAVKAQAVAARTYGLRSLRPSHYFDICDTTSCQVYGGASAEQAGSNRAIDATSNQVLLYRGTPAFTQFSSSSGGFTNQTANIAAHPYLRAVNDPWDGMANNPNHTWTQEVPASRIQSAYPQIGTLEKVRITRRSGNGAMGGRAWDIHLDGSRGSVQITGNAARSVFGLKSDWFGF